MFKFQVEIFLVLQRMLNQRLDSNWEKKKQKHCCICVQGHTSDDNSCKSALFDDGEPTVIVDNSTFIHCTFIHCLRLDNGRRGCGSGAWLFLRNFTSYVTAAVA